ncbi:MAG: biotin/lipoyl-binding protein, partial [Candidatus Peribacteraceae bacterium]
MKAFRVLVLRLNHLGRMIVTFLFRAAKKVLLWIRKHPKTSGGIGVILVLVFLGATWLFKPPAPEYILAVAERSDLQQTVEAVGTIISEKDLTLKFPVTGVVAEVFVTEGDVISVGQELARLRNDALAADVQAAAAALASKNASLRELREGTSPEDLAIAEAEVENKRAALASAKTTLAGAEEKLRTAQQKIENLRAEVDIALSGYTATSQSSASQQATAANAALQKIEDVFSTNTIRSVIMQEQSSAFTILENEIARAQNALIAVRPLITSGFGDYQTAIVSLQTTRAAIFGASRAVDSSYTFVSNLPPAGGFTTSEKETHKATLATQSSNAQAALAAIDTASKNL